MSCYHSDLWTILVYACSNPKRHTMHFCTSHCRVTSAASTQDSYKALPNTVEELKSMLVPQDKTYKRRKIFAWFIIKYKREAWLNLLESIKSSSAGYRYGVCSPTSPCCLFFFPPFVNSTGLTSHWAGASCPFLSACHVTQCNVAFLCNGLRHVMPMTCQACEFQKDTVQWKTWFSNCPGGFKP